MPKKKSSAEVALDALVKGKSKSKKKSGGGSRKIGRYSDHPSSVRYRAEKRWVSNKVLRVRRHVKRQPGDEQARSILATIGGAEEQAFLAAHPKPAAA